MSEWIWDQYEVAWFRKLPDGSSEYISDEEYRRLDNLLAEYGHIRVVALTEFLRRLEWPLTAAQIVAICEPDLRPLDADLVRAVAAWAGIRLAPDDAPLARATVTPGALF